MPVGVLQFFDRLPHTLSLDLTATIESAWAPLTVGTSQDQTCTGEVLKPQQGLFAVHV